MAKAGPSQRKFSIPNNGQIVLVSLAVGLALAGIAAHIYLGTRREDATGALAVLDHVFDLTVALTLAATLTSVGHTVCERFRLNFFNAAEEIGVSLFMGTGVVGLLVLLFGLIGWLRPVPILVLMVVCIIAARRSWVRLYCVIIKGIRNIRRSREAKVVAIIYLCLIMFLILRATTPPSAPDELIYHLSVTNDFVEHGRVYPMFDNSLGNLPFLIHMTYALCLLAGSDIAARLLSLFLAIGTSFAIFGFCSRYLSRRTAAVAIFAFFGAGMVVEVAVTSRIDVSLAGMLFLCTYAMVNYLDTNRREWLWVSALFAGFSLGIKHTAFIWLALVGLMYLVDQFVKKRESIAIIFGRGLAYTLLAIAIASPWYIKNYVWFHNPVYPLLTGEVAEFGPQGVRYFDANDERRLDAYFNVVRSELPDVVKAQEKELTDSINSRVERHPLRWWEFFLKPNTYLMAEPNHYPNYLFLVIPPLIFLRKPKWVIWLLVLSLGFVFAVTWTAWIARYLLPAYPALTIVTAYVLTSLSESLKPFSSSLEKLHVYAVAVVLGTVIAGGVQLMKMFDSWSFVSGKTSRQDIVSRFTYYRPIQFINSSLPRDARIFVVGVQLTHGIEREHVSDESWFTTKWRRVLARNTSFEEVNEDLKRQGFTHILFSADLFKFAAAMGTRGTGGMEMISSSEQEMSEEARRLGPEYQLLRNWSTFTLYKKKFLETLYSVDGFEVLRIK